MFCSNRSWTTTTKLVTHDSFTVNTSYDIVSTHILKCLKNGKIFYGLIIASQKKKKKKKKKKKTKGLGY